MLIRVTDEDIKQGVSRCNACPVALAINRVLLPQYRVGVTTVSMILVNAHDHRPTMACDCLHFWKTPLSVFAFVTSFDKMEPTEPFLFELEIPDEYLRDPIAH